MSVALETLDGRSNRCQTLSSGGTVQPELSAEELTHLCSQTALEMVSESIVFVSATTSRLIHANRAACRRLGYSRHQLQSLSLSDIAPQATPAVFSEIARRAMRGAKQETWVRSVCRHRNGSLIPVRCSIRGLSMLPENILVAVARETPRLRSPSPRPSIAEFRDSLTLLPNREWLWHELDSETQAAQDSNLQFAVLFIDIDRFKHINDSYGHLAGDQVLQAVARRLTASVRPDDCVARYGGDEFVVLMKHVRDHEDVRRMVERIGLCLEAVGKRRGEKEWRARVTVSIGVAICDGTDSSSIDAVERADRAMYRAKALGRNGRFVVDESPIDSDQSAGNRTEFTNRPDSLNELD